MQNKALLPQALVLLTDVDYLVKILQYSGSQRISNYLTFQSVDFERIRRWSFQKRLVCTNFDIYVFTSYLNMHVRACVRACVHAYVCSYISAKHLHGLYQSFDVHHYPFIYMSLQSN